MHDLLRVLDPAGPGAAGNRVILLDSLAIMLAIGLPTIGAILAVAVWYRAGNARATYQPDFEYSGRLELLVWSVPALSVFLLGGIAWVSAHRLDPAAPLPSDRAPLEIEVISLDWKWLFIYPQQGLASLNHLVVPVGVPLHLRITSASVFNVFFVPQLGSEIYGMYGMTSHLNLRADRGGRYLGLSAHFSGNGFPGMHFEVEAVPDAQFLQWTGRARAAAGVLDDDAYRQLLHQTVRVPPSLYGHVSAQLFEDIVRQRLPPGEGPQGAAH